jgi:hypothetical protein
MSDPLVFEADEPPADVAADEKPPSPDETFLGKGVRVAKPAPEPDRSETMRRLADAAAAAGARLGTLRVTAVQVPAGAAGADATGVVRLGEVSVRTVPGEGVRLADTLSEAHLSDWEVDMGTGALSSDPIVSAAVSGLEADVAADGTLRLRWTTVARFGEFETTLGYYEDPVSLDVPEATSALRTVALAPGRAVHPMFKLADGGTAAIVVEFTPDQPR